jgi:cytochrome c
MSGLLFNKIAAGVLVVALIGAGGAEVARRLSGEGHAAPQAFAAHGGGEAPAHGAPPPEADPTPTSKEPASEAPGGGEAAAEEAPHDEGSAPPDAPEAGAAAETKAAVLETAPALPAGPDYAALFAAASIEEGRTLSIKCAMCHDFTAANKTLVGPPLYDLFGRDIASLPGINYSQGPGSLSNVAGAWDADKLDRFLENPKKFAPATFMALPGMNKESERIAMMAYIRSLTAGEPKPVE